MIARLATAVQMVGIWHQQRMSDCAYLYNVLFNELMFGTQGTGLGHRDVAA
jgi:hypothetical protein